MLNKLYSRLITFCTTQQTILGPEAREGLMLNGAAVISFYPPCLQKKHNFPKPTKIAVENDHPQSDILISTPSTSFTTS